jgi:anti-sigma B factor antagonist
MSLSINGRPVGEVFVTRCGGRLTAAETQTLQSFVHRALRDHREVVMDMEHVSFLDNSGLGALVRLVQSAKSEGRHLRLCAVPERLQQAIDATQLTSIFEIYPSEGDAIVAAYMGPRSGTGNCGQHPTPVLCVIDSTDVRTLLGEVLCRAGYRALAVGNLHDAQILMKATKARLLLLGPKMQELHGVPARQIFDGIDPTAELIPLDPNFATLEPGDSSRKLVDLLEAAALRLQPPRTGPAVSRQPSVT